MKHVFPRCHRPVARGVGSKGFSLIEMLIVVAIIGLLAVIMTIAVSKTLKRQRLETAAHEIQNFLNRAYTTTSSTSRSTFVFISAPAADGSRTMTLYDDTNNNGIFESGTDAVLSTQAITNDLVLSAPPSSTAYRSWPASTSNTFIIECDTQGRSIDPPGSSTNSSTTTGVLMTLPAGVALTHAEMGSGGTLRPNISFRIFANLLWQPTIQKWVNGARVS